MNKLGFSGALLLSLNHIKYDGYKPELPNRVVNGNEVVRINEDLRASCVTGPVEKILKSFRRTMHAYINRKLRKF